MTTITITTTIEMARTKQTAKKDALKVPTAVLADIGEVPQWWIVKIEARERRKQKALQKAQQKA